MKVLHFGYSTPWSDHLLFEMMQQENILLTDIRYSTASLKKPHWSESHLRMLYPQKYICIHSLGNRNYFYREKGIEIVDLEKGLDILCRIFEEDRIPLLMCTCLRYETCHRKVVIDALLKRYPKLQVEAVC